LNKSQLSNAVADALGVAKSNGAAAVDLVLGAIGASLAAGHDVTLHDFGTFRLTHREAQPPRQSALNGKTYARPARTSVRFKPYAALRARLPSAAAPTDHTPADPADLD
jgi:nucleoid DNA-binding protein